MEGGCKELRTRSNHKVRPSAGSQPESTLSQRPFCKRDAHEKDTLLSQLILSSAAPRGRRGGSAGGRVEQLRAPGPPAAGGSELSPALVRLPSP